MTEKITFKFVDLQHQIDAIDSVVSIFKSFNKRSGSTLYQDYKTTDVNYAGSGIRQNPAITAKDISRMTFALREVQRENKHLLPDAGITAPNNCNFSIDMETGTGKTYVYLRTILELFTKYGFTKFIIIVPRIAILKGVAKAIEQLDETFATLYDGRSIKSHTLVYDGKSPGEIDGSYIRNPDLSILILNKDIFNKKANLIQKKEEGGDSLWDKIRLTKPIIIIDEPQLIEGTEKKKSKTLEQIETLRPLFTLRYSATHKNPYHTVYKLTSFDAYEQHLVKSIRVKTIHGDIPKGYPYIKYLKFTEDLKAGIEIFCSDEKRGTVKKYFEIGGNNSYPVSLHELSGNLIQYKDIFIQAPPHKLNGLTLSFGPEADRRGIEEEILTLQKDKAHLKDSSTLAALPGYTSYLSLEKNTALARTQIKIAIKAHLDKQFELLDAGKEIKALSLFFIDEVKKFRDSESPDGRGTFAKLFDEEYLKLIEDPEYKKKFKKYESYFHNYTDVNSVREGYFAIDKNKNKVELNLSKKKKLDEFDTFDTTEDDYDAKSKEDIQRGIDLILEDKEKLISFKEPLAFIFSHSALREGWDNPNIFTLCTLKTSGSEIAKKQEIGRGLRLPVDIHGNRINDEEVNKLTVVANANYEEFAAALQKDFDAEQNFDREIATDIELHETLKKANIPTRKISNELAQTLKTELQQSGILDKSGKVIKGTDITKVTFKDEILKEHQDKIKQAFTEVMIDKGSKRIIIENGDEEPEPNEYHSYMNEEHFKQLLNELTLRLEKRTFYQVKIDSQKFMEDASILLNEVLSEAKHQIFTEDTSEVRQSINKGTTLEGKKTAFHKGEKDEDLHPKNDFQIVNYIMTQTRLPRQAIYTILNRVNPELRKLLRNQNELDLAAANLGKLLKQYKCDGVSGYQVIDNYLFDEKRLFIPDTIDNETLKKLNMDYSKTLAYKSNPANRRSIWKFYKTDSLGETQFAKDLDNDENVLLFTKLHKGGFVIDTPEGEYSPDWAVIYKHDEKKINLYFVVETKIDKELENLTDVEKTKIKCGKKHFEAVSEKLGSEAKLGFIYAKNHDDFALQILKKY